MGKLEKALDFSVKSLDKNPDYIEALFLKGKSLRELEKFDEAMVIFDKILKQDSKHRDSLYQKGKIFHSLGKYRESLDLLNQGQFFLAVVYVVLTIIICLLGTWVGILITNK